MNFLRGPTFSVAFYRKFHTFISFFKKPPYFSIKKPKFRTIWELLLIQSHSTHFCWNYCFFRKKHFFSKNPDFSTGKTRFWTLWESWIFQSHSASKKLAAFSGFFTKTQVFFENSKIQSSFQEETTFLTFEKPYYFSCILQQIFIFGVFQKSQLFLRETHIFYLIKPIFDRFERSYFFSRILPQVC